MSNELSISPQELQAHLAKSQEIIGFLSAQLEEAKPKIDFHDMAMKSDDLEDMGNVAKIINIAGLGQNKLYKLLRTNKILMGGSNNNLPYQSYVDQGYFSLIEYPYEDSYGRDRIGKKTKVTQKGIQFIIKIIRKAGL